MYLRTWFNKESSIPKALCIGEHYITLENSVYIMKITASVSITGTHLPILTDNC